MHVAFPARTVVALLLAGLLAGCPAKTPPSTRAPKTESGDPEVARSSGERALAILDDLERAVDEDRATREDRKRAYAEVTALPDDGSAAYAFARAALAGRLAEARGAKAGRLVGEAEAWARRALERDPEFRDGAATKLLGSLYALAPPRLLAHGDSEKGLEMLEERVRARPDDLEAHLRLAEAYVALGDPEAAMPSLCLLWSRRGEVRGDEARLLARLLDDVGGPEVLACEGGG
ncbi:MAG: hypothetical protein D6705_11105 [Deltaproteobacteria bacterium]|nr:MAG: hypothetical protein D6705_11105 [Deltaproteobacteria bacterium]